MPKSSFTIVFAGQVHRHLDAIERRFHSIIESAIGDQLSYEPLTRTLNRKQLRQRTTFGAAWELRCGPHNRFRVLYAVNGEQRKVIIVAVCTKIGNQLYIGKEKFEL